VDPEEAMVLSSAVAGSKIRQGFASLPPSLSFLGFWNFSDANE